MRVLLINSNLRDDVLIAPPIGLCYIATAAQAAGHDVTVLDLCVEHPVPAALERSVRAVAPQVVGVSVRNIDNVNMLYLASYLPGAVDIIRRVRQITGAPIVVGGAGASLCPEAVLRATNADFIVVSEGEYSFVRLLESLGGSAHTRCAPLPDIPGVGSFRDGRFHLPPPAMHPFGPLRPDVGTWVDMRAYSRRGACYTIQTKRGCPHHCIYCTYNQLLEGHGVRLRPPADVVDEIDDALRRYRPDSFEFVDSVFNEPREHCVEILERIVRRPWKTRFTAMGVNPVNLDAGLLDLMWRAGFRSIQISPESACDAMIRRYGKQLSQDDLVQAARAIGATRFTVQWYFLVGGPGETNDTLQESLDFVFEHLRPDTRPPYNMAFFFVGVRLYPGTALWELAAREGFVTGDSDPTEPLWYLSERLDLARAVQQLLEAAARADGVVLGFDERYLPWSPLWTLLARMLRMPKPYWRHTWGLNRILRLVGLRIGARPEAVAAALREQLQRQGYRGPLVEDGK